MGLETLLHSEKSSVISQVLVDARALQDPDYRFRGIGQHSSALLASFRTRAWSAGRPKLVALVSSNLPSLSPVHAALFDETKNGTIFKPVANSVFLCLSPMTHDPLKYDRSLMDSSILKVALFYDLIPLQFPSRYLATGAARADFAVRLAWLRCFDLLASISVASGLEATAVAAIPSARVFVTGVAVRQGLEPVKNEPFVPRSDRSYYLMAGGGDPRKNPECVLIAHGRHVSQSGSSTSLRVFGSYPMATRAELRKLYASEGGRPENLNFFDHIDDETLRQQYRGAIASIVASFAEGFSVPIIESSAADTLVLVSDIPAHKELVENDAARFAPDKPDELQAIFTRLEAPGDGLWTELSAENRDLWKRYRFETVGNRFVGALDEALISRPASPAVIGNTRLKLGILSPIPPAASGVADFSAGMIKAISKIADVDVFTDTVAPLRLEGIKSLAGLVEAKGEMARLDNIVSVIGNSHHHRGEFEFLLENGGGAILHDARMINYYVILLGMERAVAVARQEISKEIDEYVISDWLQNQERLPILFLSEIMKAASPAFVHSPTTADLIDKQYGVKPITLAFPQYIEWGPEHQTSSNRRHLRDRYGIADADFLVVTFGFVSPDKAPDELIWAVKMLRDWKVPAKLLFCGGFVTEEFGVKLQKLVVDLEMVDHVSFSGDYVAGDDYKGLLFAAEAAVQLRTHFMGSISGALSDCMAAALPSVANDHLACAMGTPGFVRRVPDSLSPLLVAEALLDIIASGDDRARPVDEARLYAKEHSFETYAARLVQHLGGPEMDRNP